MNDETKRLFEENERLKSEIEKLRSKTSNRVRKVKIKEIDVESFEYKATMYLIGRLKEKASPPKTPKSDLDIFKWCEHIEKLVRLDGRSENEIKKLLKFSMEHDFWKGIIRSTQGFRKNFDAIAGAYEIVSVDKKLKTATTKFSNFKQRETNFDEIERLAGARL